MISLFLNLGASDGVLLKKLVAEPTERIMNHQLSGTISGIDPAGNQMATSSRIPSVAQHNQSNLLQQQTENRQQV